MAAGAAVLASDLPAFRQVLGGGTYGVLFERENATDLARKALALLEDQARRKALISEAEAGVRRYDWSVLAGQVTEVYETVTGTEIRSRR